MAAVKRALCTQQIQQTSQYSEHCEHDKPTKEALGSCTSVSQHFSSALIIIESSWLDCASPAAFAKARLLVWVLASQDWCWMRNVRSSCAAQSACRQQVASVSEVAGSKSCTCAGSQL